MKRIVESKRAERAVRQAQNARLPIQNIADKAAGLFTWVVLATASATFATWLLAGVSLGQALMFAAAVMVVACPCALGLATPLAVVVGVGRAAEKGLLVRNAEALEKALRAKFVAFDKTGTLTTGAPRVMKYVGDLEALALAASAEAKSAHPLAKAVVEFALDKGLKIAEPELYDAFPGMGVYAKANGKVVAVGNEKMVEAMGATLGEEWRRAAEALKEEGRTVTYVVVDGAVRGVLAVGDEVREEAAEVIAELKSMGYVPVIISGDNKQTVKKVAEQLGVERFYAETTPEDKAEIIKK